ncbi:MAG: TraR/DksA C4-type zinc finger protein [Bdellovibrionota bacterium]
MDNGLDNMIIRKFKDIFETQLMTLRRSRGSVAEEFRIEKDDMLDEVDLTSVELESFMRMRLCKREKLFLRKIEDALDRIKNGNFGLCVSCGDEICLKRLEARPTTTVCIYCKEMQEHAELIYAGVRVPCA